MGCDASMVGRVRQRACDSLIMFGAPGDAIGVLRGLVRSRHMTLVLALVLSALAAILPFAIC